MRPYRLTIIHTSGAKVRYFESWEAARDAAHNTNPDVDGSIIPNVPDSMVNDDTYVSGVFWYGNRYAIIEDIRGGLS